MARNLSNIKHNINLVFINTLGSLTERVKTVYNWKIYGRYDQVLVNIVVADALVLQQQVISIHNTDSVPICVTPISSEIITFEVDWELKLVLQKKKKNHCHERVKMACFNRPFIMFCK